MEEQYTWEHPYTTGDKTEPVQSFEAFKIWVEMGNKRSLKAVAERMEKSHDTIKKYSCTWKWSERLQDKLTYENKIIHGKQLETVLTSLEIDSRHDIALQMVMGNLLTGMVLLAIEKVDNLRPSRDMKGKILNNPHLEYLERLTNIYSKMEDIHTKNQEKIINLNNKCLTFQTFNEPVDYKTLVEHGKKEHLRIIDDYVRRTEEKNKTINSGGIVLIENEMYKPYTPTTPTPKLDKVNEQLEDKEETKEVDGDTTTPQQLPEEPKKKGTKRKRKPK